MFKVKGSQVLNWTVKKTKSGRSSVTLDTSKDETWMVPKGRKSTLLKDENERPKRLKVHGRKTR